MRMAQLLSMHGIHGGLLNSPNLTGLDAIRILAFWWRTRGRFWKGWHQALSRLIESGLKPTPAALDELMNPEQSAIVWDATLDAAKDMETIRSARNLTPRPFEQRQVDADAAKMVRRFLVKDLNSKLPPLEKTQDTAAVVVEKLKQAKKTRVLKQAAKTIVPPKLFKPKIPVDKIPKPIIPRVPQVNWGFLILLAAIAMSGES